MKFDINVRDIGETLSLAQIPGITPEDFTDAIMKLRDLAET